MIGAGFIIPQCFLGDALPVLYPQDMGHNNNNNFNNNNGNYNNNFNNNNNYNNGNYNNNFNDQYDNDNSFRQNNDQNQFDNFNNQNRGQGYDMNFGGNVQNPENVTAVGKGPGGHTMMKIDIQVSLLS